MLHEVGVLLTSRSPNRVMGCSSCRSSCLTSSTSVGTTVARSRLRSSTSAISRACRSAAALLAAACSSVSASPVDMWMLPAACPAATAAAPSGGGVPLGSAAASTFSIASSAASGLAPSAMLQELPAAGLSVCVVLSGTARSRPTARHQR